MGFRMDTPDEGLASVGTHLAEISGVKSGSSKKSGDAYWLVTWRAVSTGQNLTTDVWMLEGKGATMTKKRLRFFGFGPTAEVDGPELIGKRAHLAIVHQEFNGELQARIDSRADDSCFGMFKDVEPGMLTDDDLKTPF